MSATQAQHVPVRQTVRIAAVQYLLRAIHDWNGFEEQVRFVMKSAGDYKPQFVLLPEIFTTQLLSFMDTSDLRKSVRNMRDYAGRYVALFKELAQTWKVHVIAAEGAPNVEQIVIADVDLSRLVDNRISGTTIPLHDKRIDVYENEVEVVSAI